ncbi:MAG TPA: T9SS sorting signal type C domain-containing protein, partial [Flavobacterium sp.]|nr:T9SS sorting signal type C domain-containing protein [Flavobacterium sp.]
AGGCGGNQTWQGTGGTINIISGLTTPGNYTLEVYTEANGTPGTVYSSNNGANYKATFNYCGPSSGALPSGEYAIPGCFSTVAAAITYVNTNGTSGTGDVRFNIAAGYTETAPVGGFSITASGVPSRRIVFAKSGSGVNPTFTAATGLTAGSLTDAIFKLVGADYVTLDGLTLQDNANTTVSPADSNNKTEWGVALLYASATNGAQNNTIQNCTITLLRTYTNSFGIYSNVRHTATNTSTTADITAGTGRNNSNKFYGNTISNVNMGIALIGSPSFMDNGNDIGGTAAATGNTITNWGGAPAASSFVSTSGTSYCIFLNHQINDTVSYNTLTSAAVSGTAVTFVGIRKDYTSGTVGGTVTTNITNNTITMTSGFTSGIFQAILSQGISNFSPVATATININDNRISNCAITGASSSSSLVGISNSSAVGTLNMNRNIFTGNTSTATTGGFTGVSNTGSIVSTANIKDNQIGTASADAMTFSAATSGSFTGLNFSGGSSGLTVAITGNDMRRVVYNVTGTSALTGINFSANHSRLDLNSNTFTNLSLNNGAQIRLISAAGSGTSSIDTLSNNRIVTGLVLQGSASALTCIRVQITSASQFQITNNDFSNVTGSNSLNLSNGVVVDQLFISTDTTISGNTFADWTTSSSLTAIQCGNAASFTVSNNTIRNFVAAGAVAAITSGTPASPSYYLNNTVSGLSSTLSAVGIVVDTSSATTFTVSGNTLSNIASSGNTLFLGATAAGIALSANCVVNGNKIWGISAIHPSAIVAGISAVGGESQITNNLIGDLRSPSAAGSNSIMGIAIDSSFLVTLDNNTVFVNATSSGTDFGSSAVFITNPAALMILRNNIFVNTSVANGTGISVAFRSDDGSMTGYDYASNNNLFYAPVIFFDGFTSFSTLADFQSLVDPRDTLSVSELPTFLSTTGSDATFLHIDPTVVTKIESGGAQVSGVAYDFDNQLRNEVTPDIGADEFTGVCSTTTWDGLVWSDGIGRASRRVVFAGNYDLDADMAACSVTVNSGDVTIGTVDANGEPVTAYDLTVYGPVTVNGGSLTFEQGSNLLQRTYTGANSGAITVKTNVKAWRQDYVYWGSPVTGQNLFNFSPLTLANRFYTFSPTANAFVASFTGATDPALATTTFTSGKGYMIRMPNNFPNPTAPGAAPTTLFSSQFRGVANNGTITIPTTNGTSNCHLLSNPYPSAIEGYLPEGFLYQNPGTIYFWTHTTQAAGGNNYAMFNYLGGTAAYEGGVIPNGRIQVGQGFLFQNTNSVSGVTFTNEMRVSDHDGQFFRSSGAANSDRSRLWLNVSKDGVNGNQILVGYVAEATMGVDNAYDGILIPNGNNISTLIGADRYGIQARPSFSTDDIVPMGLRAETAGTFTVSLDHADGIFAGEQDIFLKDNLTGVVTNLKQASYSFASEAGDFNDRLQLQYVNTTLSAPDFNANTVVIYKNQDNVLTLASGAIEIQSVKIYDIRGRLVYTKAGIGSNVAQLGDLKAEAQVLLVQIMSTDGRVVTRKVVY